MKKAYVVVGDIGGCKELIPVVRALEMKNVEASWCLDDSTAAKAGNVLDAAGITYTRNMPDDTDEKPDLILVGTSATACGMQKEWSTVGRSAGVPVIWYEDLYGTASVAAVRDSAAPDVIITIDEVAAGIARATWKSAIVVAGGKPTYSDELPKLIARRTSTQKSVRDALRISESERLIVYAGMGESANRVIVHLNALGRINLVDQGGLRIAPRHHPKLREQFPNFEAIARSAMGGAYLESAGVPNTRDMLLAADVVVTDYAGDAPYQAILAGIPTIVTMFPDAGPALATRGYQNGIPPMLHAHAAWGAWSESDLMVLVSGVLRAPLDAGQHTAAASQAFKKLLEPDAARRIAGIILAHMDARTTHCAVR